MYDSVGSSVVRDDTRARLIRYGTYGGSIFAIYLGSKLMFDVGMTFLTLTPAASLYYGEDLAIISFCVIHF